MTPGCGKQDEAREREIWNSAFILFKHVVRDDGCVCARMRQVEPV